MRYGGIRPLAADAAQAAVRIDLPEIQQINYMVAIWRIFALPKLGKAANRNTRVRVRW